MALQLSDCVFIFYFNVYFYRDKYVAHTTALIAKLICNNVPRWAYKIHKTQQRKTYEIVQNTNSTIGMYIKTQNS